MKKLNDFEYDLWTTEDGRRMVRVRATKEECEVDRETFRLLRAEEKRLRRERTPGKSDRGTDHPLSLDIIDFDMEGEYWYKDPRNDIEELILKQTIQQFRMQLTTRQSDVFERCILGGMNLREYAEAEGLNYRAVWEVREAIRKKFSQI